MKSILFALTLLLTINASARVSDLEMGQYKLTATNEFLKFDSLFVGYNHSILLTGKIGGENLKAPGCIGTYTLVDSVMRAEVVCPATYFTNGYILFKIDLRSTDPQLLYSSYGDGATVVMYPEGATEEQKFSFEIKYVYPERD